MSSTARILVIDDDPDVRTVLQILLKKEGYEVDTASGRDEALQKLKVFRPNIALLDVLLSGADGREICKTIKQDPELKDIFVMMVSAHPGASENSASYGADDFVTKPMNTKALLQKLSAISSTLQ